MFSTGYFKKAAENGYDMDEKKFQQVGDAISLFDSETKRVLEANQAFHPLSGCMTEDVQTLIKEFERPKRAQSRFLISIILNARTTKGKGR